MNGKIQDLKIFKEIFVQPASGDAGVAYGACILSELKNNKKFKPRIKARIRRNKQIINKNINSLFSWIKGAELVELKECNTEEDPVRPELDNTFRTSYGRKIFGVKYNREIHAVMCFAFTNKVPKNVIELDKFSKDAHLQSTHRDQNVGQIAIAYTVWSKKKVVEN